MVTHRARQLTKADYDEFDYLIGMDSANIRNMIPDSRRRSGSESVRNCLILQNGKEDIADPWYTGNFDLTYRDVSEGCEGLLHFLEEREEELKKW